MNSRGQGTPAGRPSDAECADLVARWLGGDARAEQEVGELVSRHAQVTVRAFLGADGPRAEDLAQDTACAVMAYLRRRGGFGGSLVNFTIAVARNRCRNHLIWLRRHPDTSLDQVACRLSGSSPSPLGALMESEILELLQRALDDLDRGCRSLLRAFYLEEKSMEEIRRRIGLKTVQGVYYRRAECLKRIGRFLKSRLADCSSPQDPSS